MSILTGGITGQSRGRVGPLLTTHHHGRSFARSLPTRKGQDFSSPLSVFEEMLVLQRLASSVNESILRIRPLPGAPRMTHYGAFLHLNFPLWLADHDLSTLIFTQGRLFPLQISRFYQSSYYIVVFFDSTLGAFALPTDRVHAVMLDVETFESYDFGQIGSREGGALLLFSPPWSDRYRALVLFAETASWEISPQLVSQSTLIFIPPANQYRLRGRA